MYPSVGEDWNGETSGCSGTAETTGTLGVFRTTRERTSRKPMSVTCQPQAIMVVHSTPSGEKIHCESYLINAETGSSPATETTLNPFPELAAAKKRYESTADISCQDSLCLLPVCSPDITAGEQTFCRRCSLRETSHVSPFRRHALSVPNMGTFSPFHSTHLSPAHSNISSPGRDVEKLVKAKSKLLESESNQTPRLPPEIREQLRYVSKDGKCRVNLGHIDERGRFLSDIFTSFVDLQYRWFLFVFMMCYITTWFLFAGLYYVNAYFRGDLGPPLGSTENHLLDQKHCYLGIDGFISALLFSVETQRTIGYGSRTVSPACHEGVLLVMMQCIVGSMIDALMVGCMFVKISRPKKRAETLLFSRTCVISNRDDQLCLMFRLGDLRESHMVDAKVRAKLIKSRQTAEGEFLPLEQTEIDLGYESGSDRLFLVEPQVIKHNIDVKSPLWNLGPEQLRRQQFEIIVILEGIVEATGMMCQAKTSYIETEIEWGARFEPCMMREKGSFRVDLRRFHTTYKVPLPNCSASQAHQLMALAECRAQSHKACRNWEAWGEGLTMEEKEKSSSQRLFTIGDIQEERISEGNENEATGENSIM
ncbi:G protein-activated inward rectifier potassium channel 3 [Kryptolebias marmoratus]|uniref:G protein-activated inward rectifier potassium channel 3 n=1 Tax=Kryptolebias marmoratus TaxID=37003 RepID=A0A3Q3B413_KRYMA|nr:G protein-activated inward rectifier potassium channel 3 [Kryptolebias marmoratus]